MGQTVITFNIIEGDEKNIISESLLVWRDDEIYAA